MTSLANFLAAVGADLKAFREAERKKSLVESSAFNVFDYIRPNENRLTDIIADLLKPSESHGQGHLFLQEFIRIAGIPLENNLESARVRRETLTDYLTDNRRIDCTVEVGGFCIAIENKPWAGDQDEQVSDYLFHLTSRYGEKNFFFVYLTASGSPPSSLTPAERERLEREGQFRVMPFDSDVGLRGWLERCLNVCQAEKVRTFLRDFIQYVDEQFGDNTSERNEMKVHIVMQHVLQSDENLDIYLDAVDAFDQVKRYIVVEFISTLEERLRRELKQRGEWQLTSKPLPEANYPGEIITLSKLEWNQISDLEDGLRVVLKADTFDTYRVYFAVYGEPTEEHSQSWLESLQGRIVAALNTCCGRAGTGSRYWPFWYRYAEEHEYWSSTAVLRELWRKDLALDFFADKLLLMAEAVDSVERSAE